MRAVLGPLLMAAGLWLVYQVFTGQWATPAASSSSSSSTTSSSSDQPTLTPQQQQVLQTLSAQPHPIAATGPTTASHGLVMGAGPQGQIPASIPVGLPTVRSMQILK